MAETKFTRKLLIEQMQLDDAKSALQSEDIDLITMELERMSQTIKSLTAENDIVMDEMMESDKEIQYIKDWKTKPSVPWKMPWQLFKKSRWHVKSKSMCSINMPGCCYHLI